MQALSRDAILGVTDLKPVRVEVPEWGGVVFVRPLSGAERDSLEAESVGAQGAARVVGIRGRLAARTICDESGGRLFKDEDAPALGAKNAAALDRIVEAATKLNGLAPAEVQALGEA